MAEPSVSTPASVVNPGEVPVEQPPRVVGMVRIGAVLHTFEDADETRAFMLGKGTTWGEPAWRSDSALFGGHVHHPKARGE